MRHEIAPAFENKPLHSYILKIAIDIALSVNGHLAEFDLTLEEVIPIHIAVPVSNPNDVVLIGTELRIDMNGI